MNERRIEKSTIIPKRSVNVTELASLVCRMYTVDQHTNYAGVTRASNTQMWAMIGQVRIEQYEMQCHVNNHFIIYGTTGEFHRVAPGVVTLICDCCTLHQEQLDFLLDMEKKNKGGNI